MLHGYLTRIEELQPFNRGNPSIWGMTSHGWPVTHAVSGALQRLSELDVIDKHRVIHAVWTGIDVALTFAYAGPDALFPPEFEFRGGSMSYAPLEDGAEVCRLKFATPLPYEWHPDEVDVKRHLPLDVSFDEPSISQGVLEVLAVNLWATEAVLRIFRPLEALQPPLPVTVIPNLDGGFAASQHLPALNF